jgi:hypothetical protein
MPQALCAGPCQNRNDYSIDFFGTYDLPNSSLHIAEIRLNLSPNFFLIFLFFTLLFFDLIVFRSSMDDGCLCPLELPSSIPIPFIHFNHSTFFLFFNTHPLFPLFLLFRSRSTSPHLFFPHSLAQI